MTTANPFDLIIKRENPDEIFDLICYTNYFAGKFNGNIPIDESRKAYERIKELLTANQGQGEEG